MFRANYSVLMNCDIALLTSLADAQWRTTERGRASSEFRAH